MFVNILCLEMVSLEFFSVGRLLIYLCGHQGLCLQSCFFVFCLVAAVHDSSGVIG